MFKLLAALLAIVAFTKGWYDVDLECIQELNLNKTEVAEFATLNQLPTDNESIIKLAECVFNKRHYFDASGNVDFDAFEERLQQEMPTFEVLAEAMKHAFKECRDKTYDGVKGVIAIKVRNCIYKSLTDADAEMFGNN